MRVRASRAPVFTAIDLARAAGLQLSETERILDDFAARGIVERVLQSGYRATPHGLALSRGLSFASAEGERAAA